MSKFNTEVFSKTIKSKRKWNNMSVREAAKDIGISAATLSRIENGHLVDLLTYYSVCSWLSLDMEYFFNVDKITK